MNLDPARELEPKDGDFIAYLKELEEGKINTTGGLHVSLPDGSQQGMVLVQTTQEIAEDRSAVLAQRRAASRTAALALMSVVGALAGLASFALLAVGIAYPDEFEFLIPFGMVLLFVSVVVNAETRKRKKANERTRSE